MNKVWASVDEIKIGDLIRFYTNTTRPDLTVLGFVTHIEKNGDGDIVSFSAGNAVMKYRGVLKHSITEVNNVPVKGAQS